MKEAIIFLCGIMTGFWVPLLGGVWEVHHEATAATDERVVEAKLSLTGICHPLGSQFYNYLKFYTEYDSVTQCVLEGGRLPQRVKNNVRNRYNDLNNDLNSNLNP